MTAPTPESPTPLTALRHELRTPLAAVIGFADAMRERAFGPLSEPYLACAEAIDKAARHMLELVDRVADGGSDRKGPVDAAAAVSEVVQMLQPRAQALGVALTVRLPKNPLTVAVDATHFTQIAINLIANALAATPRNGRVAVVLELRGDDVIFSVVDTGPGRASDSVDGVGLQLVQALCAAYGGVFELTSGPEGARAVSRLPVTRG